MSESLLQAKGKKFVKTYFNIGDEPFSTYDLLDAPSFNRWLSERIEIGGGTLVARLGSVESDALAQYLSKGNACRFSPSAMKAMQINAGFFNVSHQGLRDYCNLMLGSLGAVDCLGLWTGGMQEYVIDSLRPALHCRYTELRNIEPYYSDRPWSASLACKNVLVIHPFAETIESQYRNNRDKLFPESDTLPDFRLHTLKAVQTIGGNADPRFHSWFEALEWMANEALKIDFDVVLIGCGAYGLPLAAMMKEAGKTAVHMGGATQILFGIKGKRWVNHDYIKKLFNDAWVWPSKDETPDHARKVEGACYWADQDDFNR